MTVEDQIWVYWRSDLSLQGFRLGLNFKRLASRYQAPRLSEDSKMHRVAKNGPTKPGQPPPSLFYFIGYSFSKLNPHIWILLDLLHADSLLWSLHTNQFYGTLLNTGILQSRPLIMKQQQCKFDQLHHIKVVFILLLHVMQCCYLIEHDSVLCIKAAEWVAPCKL